MNRVDFTPSTELSYFAANLLILARCVIGIGQTSHFLEIKFCLIIGSIKGREGN